MHSLYPARLSPERMLLMLCSAALLRILRSMIFSFPVSGACPDTLNTLEALGAQLDTTEYQMEWTPQTTDSTQNQMQLPYSQEKANQSDTFLNSSPSPDDSETLCWSFHTGISESPSSDCPVGTFLTTWTGNDCVCLHQVEILPAFAARPGHCHDPAFPGYGCTKKYFPGNPSGFR